MRRHGFTWIELLAVFAILGALAALLVPVFLQRSHVGSRRSPCQENLREIGLAIKQYLSDNNENFPNVNGNGRSYGWADALQPYLSTPYVLQCPTETTSPDSTGGPASPTYTDYFYNARLANQTESTVQYISSTVMLGDARPGDARQHSTGGGPKLTRIAKLVNTSGFPVGAATRHLDGANYCFADGHVKWLKGLNATTCPAIRANASGATNPTFSIN